MPLTATQQQGAKDPEALGPHCRSILLAQESLPTDQGLQAQAPSSTTLLAPRNSSPGTHNSWPSLTQPHGEDFCSSSCTPLSQRQTLHCCLRLTCQLDWRRVLQPHLAVHLPSRLPLGTPLPGHQLSNWLRLAASNSMANDLGEQQGHRGKTVSKAQAHPQPAQGFSAASMPQTAGSCQPRLQLPTKTWRPPSPFAAEISRAASRASLSPSHKSLGSTNKQPALSLPSHRLTISLYNTGKPQPFTLPLPLLQRLARAPAPP